MANVVMIGTGNVATVLSKMIVGAGHTIVQVAGRSSEKAKILATEFNCKYTSIDANNFENANIYIIALSDDALASLHFPSLKNKLVVHTAGSVSINAVTSISENAGVLYPLQTLSSVSNSVPPISFLVDGNTDEALGQITQFAQSLSPLVRRANDGERRKYHIAAVVVCNFVNHLLALGEDYCHNEGLDFHLLLPLINEVNRKANEESPIQSQTGPAIRNDQTTLQSHLHTLKKHAHLKEIYQLLSQSILKFYESK